MRALITGGAGFIGFHVGRRLAKQGHDVVLLDSLVRGRRDADLEALLSLPNVQIVVGDLEDSAVVEGLTGSFDRVYHLAAIVGVQHVTNDPGRVLRVNARTTLNVLDFAKERRCSELFFASTSETYAWTAQVTDIPIPTPEGVPLAVDSIGNRRASYALSKIFGEMALVHGLAESGTSLVCGRFHNVYGPRMGTAHVVPELYLRMRSERRPVRVPESTAKRAFCYVDDAVDAVELLLRTGAAGIFNIGNDQEEVEIGTLARMIADIAGLSANDLDLDRSHPTIPRRCPDISRLRDVGFAPRVSLRPGIRSTLEWYMRNQVAIGV